MANTTDKFQIDISNALPTSYLKVTEQFGSNINIGSIYGSRSPHHAIYKGENFFSSLAYTTSKSGLIGLTKWLATKYAKENTSFNMISPAGVYNKQTPSFIKKYLELIPKGRMANPKDIFGVLKLLISEDSNYITGQNIHVDGGFTSW